MESLNVSVQQCFLMEASNGTSQEDQKSIRDPDTCDCNQMAIGHVNHFPELCVRDLWCIVTPWRLTWGRYELKGFGH